MFYTALTHSLFHAFISAGAPKLVLVDILQGRKLRVGHLNTWLKSQSIDTNLCSSEKSDLLCFPFCAYMHTFQNLDCSFI